MKKDKKLIVFVCRGNIHRSPIGEQVLKKLLKERGLEDKFEVISRGISGTAGTKPPEYKNILGYPEELKASKPTLRKLNIDITKHEARPITEDIVKKAVAIIAMDKYVHFYLPHSLVNQFPLYKNKIHLLTQLEGKNQDIPDCRGFEDPEFHRAVIERIYNVLNNHFDTLMEWTKETTQNY